MRVEELARIPSKRGSEEARSESDLRIGIYLSGLGTRRGYENNVSGHVQVPIRSAELLRRAGHSVELITPELQQGEVYPSLLPVDLRVHHVVAARKTITAVPEVDVPGGRATMRRSEPTGRVLLLRALRQARQIRDLAKDRQLDLLHVFGGERSVDFASFLSAMHLGIPIVATLVSSLRQRSSIVKHGLAWRRIDRVIVPSRTLVDSARSRGAEPIVLGHGVIRDLLSETPSGTSRGSGRRVLFWREASLKNGADVCRDVFDQLAPQYRDWIFEMAVRPCSDTVPGLGHLADRHSNVVLYEFPYPAGLSIAELVTRADLILLPFRTTTITPQLAIAESLYAGIPVVTTSVDANPELIVTGENGVLVPPGDVDATTMAVQRLIEGGHVLKRMAEKARPMFQANWNWNSFVDDVVSVYSEARRQKLSASNV